MYTVQIVCAICVWVFADAACDFILYWSSCVSRTRRLSCHLYSDYCVLFWKLGLTIGIHFGAHQTFHNIIFKNLSRPPFACHFASYLGIGTFIFWSRYVQVYRNYGNKLVQWICTRAVGDRIARSWLRPVTQEFSI